MPISKISFCLLASILIIACGTASNEEKKAKQEEVSENSNEGEGVTDLKKEQLNLLISESKRTMDSIDIAYKYIRRLSPMLNLSADDRQQVNEALMEMNSAKELIILETQQVVIDQLKEKSASLNIIMADMNLKSEKLKSICATLTKVCGMIEKTTNVLATALTTGLIRPKLSTALEKPAT